MDDFRSDTEEVPSPDGKGVGKGDGAAGPNALTDKAPRPKALTDTAAAPKALTLPRKKRRAEAP